MPVRRVKLGLNIGNGAASCQRGQSDPVRMDYSAFEENSKQIPNAGFRSLTLLLPGV